MRDKDRILLENCYSDIGKKVLREESGDDVFVAEVKKVYVSTDNPEEDLEITGRSLQVIYKIEIDYRSWGIKDINVPAHNIKLGPFSIKAMDGDFNEREVLKFDKPVDASNFQIDFEPIEINHSFYPTSVSLRVAFLDGKYSLVPEGSEIRF